MEETRLTPTEAFCLFKHLVAEGRKVNLAEVLGADGLLVQCETSDHSIAGRGRTLEAAAADAARQHALWQTIEIPPGRDV